MQPLLNTKQAARVLGLSYRQLESLRLRGGGPLYVKLGRAVRYREEDLADWIEDRIRSSTKIQENAE